MTTTPIVVGVAATREARAALDWATDEARLRGRPLLLVRAVGEELAAWLELLPNDTDGVVRGVLADADRLLADAQAGVHDRAPDVAVRTEVSRSGPAEALTCRAADADTLVVGNHGGPGAVRGVDVLAPWLGSAASCPVVVVPQGGPARSLLVLADGSPTSADTLAYAFRQAELRGLVLRVVLCLPDPSPTASGDELHLLDTVERLEQAAGPSWLGFERRVLQGRVAAFARLHRRVSVRLVDSEATIEDALARAVREREVVVADAGHARRLLDLADGVSCGDLAAVTVLLPSTAAVAPVAPVAAPGASAVEVHPAPELVPVPVRRRRLDERGPWRHAHRYADDPDVA